jgi:hypothetical protein
MGFHLWFSDESEFIIVSATQVQVGYKLILPPTLLSAMVYIETPCWATQQRTFPFLYIEKE